MFQFLSRNSVRWDGVGVGSPPGVEGSFNSSVGILSVGTRASLDFKDMCIKFQFLSRNSVRWDIAW